MPALRLTFLKRSHLRRPAEFDRVFAEKRRASDRTLLIYGTRNGLGWTRIGLSVSRKHGGAVRRVRLRRLLREAFRIAQHDIPPGLDLVLIPQAGAEWTLDDGRRSLVALARQLARKLPAATPDSR